MTDIEQRVLSGELYDPNDPAILALQTLAIQTMYEYNQTRAGDEHRATLLKQMLAACGKDCYIEAPFHANWGGRHVHFGDQIYANFNLTMVDDGEIFVGSQTMIGPNVTLATAGHPVLPELRAKGYQYNLPIHIGQNCWLGANVTVLPGVAISDNTVVGAGSVVTKDLPANVVAVGSPCRVLRAIGPNDRRVYRPGRVIPPELLATLEQPNY